MPEETLDVEAITDLAEKAQVIAEATNRRQEDVLADLLDDGQANMSAGADAATQDFLDKAQEQAEKLKGLLTTLIPIILLLGGVGAEGLGVLDLTDWGSNSMWEDDPNNIRRGCTAYDAANYNSNANEDDGSCYWDNQPPPCNPQWYYDEYGYLDDNNLEVRFAFQDNAGCNIEHFGGHFIITLFESGEPQNPVFLRNIDFVNGISMEYTFEDLAEGNYHYRVEFHVVECEDGSCEHGDEYYLPSSQQFIIEPQEEPEGCDAYLINAQAYLLESDSEQDAVRISADVDLVEEEDNCDSEQFEITWRLYENNNPDVIKYEHQTFEDGKVSDPDGADYTFHTWDGVSVGTYEPKIILRLNGEVLDEQWIAHTIDILEPEIWGCTDSEATNFNSEATDDDGSCEYPEPETCEINLFQIALQTNATHATVAFDLDCGQSQNDLDGYNVSVQFLIYPVNATSEENIIVYDTALYYIQGYVDDTHTITLTNFSDNNTTHYDIYWFAIWTDADGTQQFIEQKWLNREMNPEA